MKPVPVEKYFDVGRGPQTITWYVFAVVATVNQTVQLDKQEFKLSADIRHLYGQLKSEVYIQLSQIHLNPVFHNS